MFSIFVSICLLTIPESIPVTGSINVLTWPFQVHRVMIPEVEIKRRVPRRSLVLFYDPDDETIVTCLDGSNKYPPIKAGDWLYQQLHSTYKY